MRILARMDNVSNMIEKSLPTFLNTKDTKKIDCMNLKIWQHFRVCAVALGRLNTPQFNSAQSCQLREEQVGKKNMVRLYLLLKERKLGA